LAVSGSEKPIPAGKRVLVTAVEGTTLEVWPTEGPVGYIGAHAADNDRARDRRRGYDAALRAAKRKIEPSLCVETALDIESGARALGALVDRRPDVRAVFCSADAIAVGALHECHRRKLAVPGRVAVAGFDDIPIAEHVAPELTTIRIPRYAIGRHAGEMIVRRLAGRPLGRRVVDTGFELIARGSA